MARLTTITLILAAMLAVSTAAPARVLYTGSVSDFEMDIMPMANMTVDDWFNLPNVWTLAISNTADGKTIRSAVIHITISSDAYPEILQGDLTVVGHNGFLLEMAPGAPTFLVNNTMIREDMVQMSGGRFDDDFKEEVLRIGYLPEGKYHLVFTLTGYYDTSGDRFDDEVDPIDTYITIRNALPPQLISPPNLDDNVVIVPRFAWEAPSVSDFSAVNNRMIRISYILTLWRMTEDDGTVLSDEDAITRIPIWRVNIPAPASTSISTQTSIDFDPGTAREELRSGNKYCWQVQAVDGTGRPISTQNEGKSEVYDFTVNFTPPSIMEPLTFNPLSFSWTPARTGGNVVQYTVSIADNPDYAGAFVEQGIARTSYRYTSSRFPLMLGTIYYLKVQATDDRRRPAGEPNEVTFTLPPAEVTLSGPEDGIELATTAPTFEWSSNSTLNMITIELVRVSDAEAAWTSSSRPLTGTRWTYDGQSLDAGRTYEWFVTPVNATGDPVGEPSPRRRFTLPTAGQVTLVGPAGITVESLLPTFTWNEFNDGQGSVTYSITIRSEAGEEMYSTTTGELRLTYPADATPLLPAARYEWSVGAQRNGVEVGTQSRWAAFSTPIGTGGAEETATIEEIGTRLNQILAQYSQYAPFSEMVLTAISDETGPLTPAAFLELFDRFKIFEVTAE